MDTVETSAKLTIEELVAAVEKLSTEELTEFVRRIAAIQTQQGVTLPEKEQLSAFEARHVADQAVFGDLVDCALRSETPLLVSQPTPHWRVPYRFSDGKLLAIVAVDAYTGRVFLTNEKRTTLLEQAEHLTAKDNISS